MTDQVKSVFVHDFQFLRAAELWAEKDRWLADDSQLPVLGYDQITVGGKGADFAFEPDGEQLLESGDLGFRRYIDKRTGTELVIFNT